MRLLFPLKLTTSCVLQGEEISSQMPNEDSDGEVCPCAFVFVARNMV